MFLEEFLEKKGVSSQEWTISFSGGWENYGYRILGEGNPKENFSRLSYREKYARYEAEGRSFSTCVLHTESNRLFFGLKNYGLNRHGKSIYLTSKNYLAYFEVRDGKIKYVRKEGYLGDFEQALFFLFDMMSLPYDWIQNAGRVSVRLLISSQAVLLGVLSGKLTSEEKIWKTYIKGCHFGNLPWREVKKFKGLTPNSLYDLRDFTNNMHSNLIAYNKIYEDVDADTSLYDDTLFLAIQRGEKINFNWSVKRTKAEHDRMMKAQMQGELSDKKDTPVYDVPAEDRNDGFILLNSERDVFLQAEVMHNCLYTNYWSEIIAGRYLAYNVEEDGCTLGVYVKYDLRERDDGPSEERYKYKLVPVGLSLDQIRGIYNSKVKDETRKKAQSFLRKNRKAILEMLTLHKTDNY